MDTVNRQLQSIHAMLEAGQRSVHLERHTILLIGGVGGFIAALTESIITTERFPDTMQRAVALLLWLTFWLGGMSWIDHRLTRRARERRDETLPFAQAQINRAWWMLLCVGTLSSFAMFFYGGGTMIYALWIVLLGLGVYLFGLFAAPLVEWIGLATILLGVASLALGIPYAATHWLAASCFLVGMPMAGGLAGRFGRAPLPARALALLAWVVVVTAPALLITRTPSVPAPGAMPLPLRDSRLGVGEQTLRLDAGTPVALHVDMEGPVMALPPDAGLPMRLSVPVEIALRDGTPDGRFRLADGSWHSVRDGVLTVRIDRLTPALEHGEAVVRAHAVVSSSLLKEEPR